MIRSALVCASLTLSLPAMPAAAQQAPCTERPTVVDHLASEYSERPVAIGLASNGGVIEVLSSQKSGSWTLIITMPNGPTCMIAAGENWELVPKSVNYGPKA